MTTQNRDQLINCAKFDLNDKMFFKLLHNQIFQGNNESAALRLNPVHPRLSSWRMMIFY